MMKKSSSLVICNSAVEVKVAFKTQAGKSTQWHTTSGELHDTRVFSQIFESITW